MKNTSYILIELFLKKEFYMTDYIMTINVTDYIKHIG